jgi:hypothetical protein
MSRAVLDPVWRYQSRQATRFHTKRIWVGTEVSCKRLMVIAFRRLVFQALVPLEFSRDAIGSKITALPLFLSYISFMQWDSCPGDTGWECLHISFVLALPLPHVRKIISLKLGTRLRKLAFPAAQQVRYLKGTSNAKVFGEENVKDAVVELFGVANLVGAGFFGGLESGSRFAEAAVAFSSLE